MLSNWIINLREKVKRSCPKARALLGIDLDLENGLARVVQLSHRGEFYVLEQCAVIDGFSAGNLTDSHADVASALSCALQQFVEQRGYARQEVAVALPFSAVVNNEITLNCNLNAAELNNFLQVHLSKQVNCKADEMNFDYQVLLEQKNFMRIFVVAARKSQQAQLIKVIKTANLSAKIIDVDIYALARAARFLLATKILGNIAIINFSVNNLLLCILRGEKLLHAQSESVVINIENYNQDAIAVLIDNNLKSCLNHMAQQVELVLLCGECGEQAVLLQQSIAERTKLPVIIVDPFQHSRLQIASFLDRDEVMSVAPKMMVALGLALRGVEREYASN